MTITEPIDQQAGSDEAAIAELHELFDLQRAAFLRDTYPSVADRRARLEALMGMVVGNRDRIHAALREDFAVHPAAQSDMTEVLTVMGRAAFTHQHLEEWMAPDPRETDPNLHGSARAAISYQPKGVVGNMSPWNFPFDLSLGPLVDMLAAGNRAILKPSEYTPACSALLREGGNLLLLDEPTNDLDVDTLRALEEALLSFAGCAVIVSHDRWFLDRVATHVLAFEGDSQVRWFEGNFEAYESFRREQLGADADRPHRLTYKKLVRA